MLDFENVSNEKQQAVLASLYMEDDHGDAKARRICSTGGGQGAIPKHKGVPFSSHSAMQTTLVICARPSEGLW
jgi:hypothetical protein